ncbi:double-strand break repair helicase AddA [Erythrobacter sp. THAF29]|uniref:double-strand break repair helicase AddA n=1 Tax=Erythrobacter sp. THAF29 TaxID=2587851 RepID=UPI001267C865|nr:double-strand break repair helicase AddA [Erythrobacter sp. THAF29]QFT77674.1 ATP-dependent helicase/nuclease subunit A [Erythrobacter sp. THAF29]
MSGEGKVYPLRDEQRLAADPEDNVWLSASAGTGKTQVLSARVLRLLLRPDVDPSEILCLTFTKAGAAEMATRINAVLARWVRLDETKLFAELEHLGADKSEATRQRARTLFAKVLDCPGGGLRIDTIHAFSQWLLASFPEEADLPPGAQPMEDRTRELLAREVLADVLVEAEETGDRRLLDAVELFVTAKDPGALHGWLMRCASAEGMWEGAGGWLTPMDARVRTLLGMPADAGEDWAFDPLDPDTFPDEQLRSMLPLMQAWNAQTGVLTAEFIPDWLGMDLACRTEAYPRFFETVLKKNGEPRQMAKPSKEEPRLLDWQQAVADSVGMVEERQSLLALADLLTAALEIGRAFALRWQEAKRREGLLDFDDLIRRAARLLKEQATADWIRYKLDRQFDHILIDEAQDTNEAQWDIVFALIDDFFSGDGASGDKLRTIFTVGDYKQAIFGFQGTSPENFARAKTKVEQAIRDAKANIAEMRDNRREPGWQDLDLGRSFRTSQPVLTFVNRAIALLGHEAFGLDKAPADHRGEDRPGLVTMWKPVTSINAIEEGSEDEEHDWLPEHDTLLAEKIAEQVRRWVSEEDPIVLAKSLPERHAKAGDIMVLLRKRGELARQIVAKLHAKGVPVAGVDRLRLGAPLAVKDLMAALRFAAQPLDDLSLANLLSSPLMGWSQDDLLAHLPRGKDLALWRHLRDCEDPFVAGTCEKLKALLARADFETPQALLAWLLAGPWRGRQKLIARLGREANDPLDELVNAAFAFESAHTPSLVSFIEWFDASNEDLKRDADSGGGQVRVMTVHGSKGLQAPIVILADATGAPGRAGDLQLDEEPLGDKNGITVPLPPLSKEHKRGRVAEAAEATEARDMEEHWRLLYVAMTRAEEALFIGGSLGKKDEKKLEDPEKLADRWYFKLEQLFGEEEPDDLWGYRRELGERAGPLVAAESGSDRAQRQRMPDWAAAPIGPEPSPPRPLAPSAAGEEQGADPPLPPDALAIAARRGVLIHRLLERLPDMDPGQWMEAGRAWLARQASDLGDPVLSEILSSALAVLGTPDFAEIFSPDALAEVPLAATVDGTVIAGTADRLLVTADKVTVVDFKTTRRPPRSVDEIPATTLRQMAAYVAALESIFPGRSVRAAVLYTHSPRLFEVPPGQIQLHKDRLGEAQESYAPLDVE